MSLAEDYAATRQLRSKKRTVQDLQKKILLDVNCTNLECRYSYMVELGAGADYPKTVKCPKCRKEAEVTRRR